jgi:nicotine blue oxidoreductase
VLIGREHFAGVMAAAVGDRGARDYLASTAVVVVECGDLAGGADVDEPG